MAIGLDNFFLTCWLSKRAALNTRKFKVDIVLEKTLITSFNLLDQAKELQAIPKSLKSMLFLKRKFDWGGGITLHKYCGNSV